MWAIFFATLPIMVILGHKHPYAVISRNYMELNNEFFLLLVLDLLFTSSDPKLDGD